MKKTRLLSICIVICVLLSLTATAYEKTIENTLLLNSSQETSVIATAVSLDDVEDTPDVLVCQQSCIFDSIFSLNELDLLRDLGVDNSTSVVDVDTIQSDDEGVYKKIHVDENNFICVNDNNEIYRISNLLSSVDSNLSHSIESNSATNDEIISNIRELLNLGADYTSEFVSDFDDEYLNITIAKKYGNVLNMYESVNVMVRKIDGSIAYLRKFSDMPSTTEPLVSETDALTTVEAFLNDVSASISEVSLCFIKPNFMWTDGGPYARSEDVRLAYKVEVEDRIVVYIDATTGENIGGEEVQAINGKAFALQADDATKNAQYAEKARLAKAGMQALGYSMLDSYVSSSSNMRDEILDFWSSSTAYGFYISCHGNTNVLGDGPNGLDDWKVYSDEVSGNWYFVFLDACKTAVNTDWADAFSINGYTNRAYLGWYDDVYLSYALDFCRVFWDLVGGSTSIRDCAVAAAEEVPNLEDGSPSTPIRFYGDRNYIGGV